MAYTTIKKPSDYFNTVLYTGTGATQSITGVGFQPDFTWIKPRSIVDNHVAFDAVRGATKVLKVNLTNAESTVAQTLTSFNSDGFSIGSDGEVSGNNATYASWNWLANNTSGSANTDGSITSTVSANTTSGFSIVSYTGTGSAATIGHGLGVAPGFIIFRDRDATQDWFVYHKSVGATKRLKLNQNVASATSTFINDTTPSSTVFNTEGGGATGTSGNKFIAYCFAEKQGFSKFGSYVGNGSTNGTFVYTGFKPAWVLVKCTSAQADWELSDNKRTTSGGNVIDKEVRPNSSAAETGGTDGRYIDYVSNGFKLRQGFGNWNDSGATYIYMAFAEEPLVGDNPATAR